MFAASKQKKPHSEIASEKWQQIGQSFPAEVPENQKKPKKSRKTPKKKEKKAKKKKRKLKSNSNSEEEIGFSDEEILKNKRKSSKKQQKSRSTLTELPKKEKNPEKPAGFLYEIDTAGDLSNLQFDTLYDNECPIYHLPKKWRGQKISPEIRPQDSENSSNNNSRYFTVEAREALFNREQKRIHFATLEKRLFYLRKQHTITASPSFLPLEIYEEEESAASTMGEMSTDFQYNEARFVQENKQFLERLEKEGDGKVELWMEFISFQEKPLTRSKYATAAVGKKQLNLVTRGIRDKQLQIYQKALLQLPSNSKLHHAFLDFLFYKYTTVVDNGSVLIKDHMENMLTFDCAPLKIWDKYIQVEQQNDFANFSVPKLRNLYARALNTLYLKVITNASQSVSISYSDQQSFHRTDLVEETNATSYSDLLEVFYMICSFEMKTGYTEHAIGMFQALFELNLCTPETFKNQTDLDILLQSFFKYWDNEYARFGEPSKINSWDAFYNSKEDFNGKDENPKIPSDFSVCFDDFNQNSFDASVFEKMHLNAFVHNKSHPDQVEVSRNKDKIVLNNEDRVLNEEEIDGDEIYAYSNLHGEKILIDLKKNDAEDYQRVLSDLRGHDFVEQCRTLKEIEKKQSVQNAINVLDDRYCIWLKEEELASMNQWLPLRSSDADDNQPDRIVMSEEIRPFVFPLPTQYHKLEMIVGFFQLVGVKFCAFTHKDIDLYEDSVVLYHNVLYESIGKSLHGGDSTGEGKEKSTLGEETMYNLNHVHTSTFIDGLRFLQNRHKVMFVRNLFHQCIELYVREDNGEIANYLRAKMIEFEMCLCQLMHENDSQLDVGKLYSKLADKVKVVLQKLNVKTNSDLALWEVYVILSSRLKSLEKIKKKNSEVIRVCDQILINYRKIGLSCHWLLFYRCRAEFYIENHTNDSTLKCLYTLFQLSPRQTNALPPLSKVTKKNPKTKLSGYLHQLLIVENKERLVKWYEEDAENALRDECNKWQFEILHRKRSILPYCVHNLVLVVYSLEKTAAAVESTYFKWISKIDKAKEKLGKLKAAKMIEWLAVAQLELMQRITSRRSRAEIRTSLQKNWSLCSSDLLLRFILDRESRLNNLCWLQLKRNEMKSLTFALANLSVELRYGYDLERLRYRFEQLLQDGKLQANAVVWRLYLRLEVQSDELEQGKKVFYRGIHKCPWSRDFFYDAIRLLRPVFTEDELEDLLQLMISKDLHVRQDFL